MLLFKNVLFTVLVPGTVAVFLPLMIAEGRSSPPLWARALASPVFAVGASICAWCVWDFASFGRGTPAPVDAPKRLVVRGLYRHVRNPMYVGVLTAILAWAILYRTAALVLYAGIVGVGFHLVVVLYEERRLRQAFGEEYDLYRDRVPRWLPGRRTVPGHESSSRARPYTPRGGKGR